MSENATIKPFDPETTCDVTCQITQYQDQYFYTDSFQEAKEKLRYIAKTIGYTVQLQIMKTNTISNSVVIESSMH